VGVLAVALVLLVRASGLASPMAEGATLVASLDRLLERPGPALRAAVTALERGEVQLADALLAAVTQRHGLIADHADLLRLELRVESGRYADAVDLGKHWSHSGSPVASDFYALLGRAHAALGDEASARSAWEYAALETRDRDRQAELRLAIAESVERGGNLEETGEALLLIWTRYPGSNEAEHAEVSLARLERQRGHSLRGASAHRQRAEALYRQRENEQALAAYDQALALGLADAERETAQHGRAETLFRLRRYTEAARAFEALSPTDERGIQHARAVARAGDVPRGARELEKLGEKAEGNQAARALLLAALLREGEGESKRANELYASLLRRAPRSSYADAARWRLGWSALRDGRNEEAIDYFEALEANEKDPVAALRPRYWRIRAGEQLGEDDVDERYAALAREFPLSYYGWRARERAGEGSDARSLKKVRSGRTALTETQLARPRILLEAGLDAQAHLELDQLFRRARGMHDRLALAQLYANAGDYHRPQRLMVDAYTESLARGPVPDQLELWWHAWPMPFDEEMRGATLDGAKIEPQLVYAIMREESGYRPQVVSVSGARGLLQLMPETAERVARETQAGDVSLEDLFLPRVNIQLGSDYLSSLLERFDGRTSAAIGSYNAGPRAVAQWVANGPAEDDAWVEEIPYDQTRSYVKRVLRSLHAYRVLY
jgi:soluble lytic murein transglycosylase